MVGFLRGRPESVGVYDGGTAGSTKLIKDLLPSRETAQLIESTDTANEMPGQCARIYVFLRIHPSQC